MYLACEEAHEFGDYTRLLRLAGYCCQPCWIQAPRPANPFLPFTQRT